MLKNECAEKPLIADVAELQSIATTYDVPLTDVSMIALNASGIAAGDTVHDRKRCVVTTNDGKVYPVALTVTSEPFSPFRHTGSAVELNGDHVFEASSLEPDTCTSTYWRNNNTDLTLNSNSRSNCRGCTFCGTFTLGKNDELPLNTTERLEAQAEQLCEETNGDLSAVKSVGVVTGCFSNEQRVVDHLQLIRGAFGKHGFDGELRYIGSQLRSPEALKAVTDSGKFALFLTVELFERREQMMKRTKSSLSLEDGRDVLDRAKSLGADTSILYIAGLDTLVSMAEEFPRYKDVLTRCPNVQTFQAYTPNQAQLREPGAAKIDYFMNARKIIEVALPDIPPVVTDNFRGLWFTKFGGQLIADGLGAVPQEKEN